MSLSDLASLSKIMELPSNMGVCIPVWFIWAVPDPVDRHNPFSILTGLWLIEAYLQSLKSIALCFRMQDRMSPRNLGSQINISMRYTRIDKTNIPSMRRVEKESARVQFYPA